MKEKDINTTEYIKIIKESPEKKKTYIFFGFSVFVMIILIFFAIRPTILTITRIDSEIKEKSSINSQLESKMNTLNDLDSQYIDVKKEMTNLQLIFPANDNFSLLMSNIDAISARNGFTLTSINFDTYKSDNYASTTRVLVPKLMRISVKGRESNLINLLRDLEDLPMYPVLDLVSYSTQLDKDGLNSFTMSLRIFGIDNDKFYE